METNLNDLPCLATLLLRLHRHDAASKRTNPTITKFHSKCEKLRLAKITSVNAVKCGLTLSFFAFKIKTSSTPVLRSDKGKLSMLSDVLPLMASSIQALPPKDGAVYYMICW